MDILHVTLCVVYTIFNNLFVNVMPQQASNIENQNKISWGLSKKIVLALATPGEVFKRTKSFKDSAPGYNDIKNETYTSCDFKKSFHMY